MAFQFAFSMARELKALGINLNFAPCLDTLTEPRNEVIGDRAISQDSQQVTKLGSALLRGYLKGEILSCAKHFPGHGNTLLDSHKALPKETQIWERLQKSSLQPFEKAFRSQLKMVMTAHILFENIDPQWPASLSPVLVQKYLRKTLRYEGLVISDDLGMKALTLSFSPEEIALQVLQGGSDILLYCNEPETPVIALESLKKAYKEKKLEESLLKASTDRIVRIKKEQILPWEKTKPPLTCIGCEEHTQLQEAILANKILYIAVAVYLSHPKVLSWMKAGMSPSSEPFTLMERQRNQRRWAAKPAHQAWGSHAPLILLPLLIPLPLPIPLEFSDVFRCIAYLLLSVSFQI